VNRRAFVTSTLTGAALAQPASGLIRPRALRPGDTVGLITPSYYVSDPDSLATAARTMDFFGLKFKLGENVRKRAGYLGGSAAERLDDLHAMFRDPGIAAIFCIRGGYGAGQLLDRVDYDLIRRNPKIFLGYSDITALHLAIQKKAGLVTFHGPMPLARFTNYTREHWKRAMFESKALGNLTNPPESDPLRPAHTLRAVRAGKARGPLVGGNLSLISNTLGTPYEVETRGRILLIEDVGEQPYAIDRMLTHLRLAGKFDGVAGVVWGECSRCSRQECQSGPESTFSTGEVVDEILGKLTCPVLSGLTFGHTDDQLTLPMGVMATLDAGAGTLEVEEPGTE
jgi:muramoyltetrapeptide carboxypeptidase